jgi:hypothetical protein
MSPINKSDLDAITMTIASAMSQGFAQLQQTLSQTQTVVLPKAAAKPHFLPKGSHAAPTDLASKDAALINAFHRKGFKDVQLMDRTDPNKPFNVRPFKGWLEQGRIVRKGSKGIRGLFHQHQTDPLPSAKPAKKAKPQATLPLA